MDLPPPPPPSNSTTNDIDKPKWKKTEEIQMQSKSGKVVLILARYTFPFHNWIDENHLRIMIAPIEAKTEISGDIKKKFAHIEFVPNYESSGMVEFKAVELNKKYKFTHVCYQAEQDIIRAARLRELFELKGQSVKSAIVFRDKVTMKEHLSSFGLSVPKFRRVTSYLSIFEHIKENGYPVVCKPTCGMGSINTSIVKNEEDLKKLISNQISVGVDGPIDLEVENFAKGEMYHCDGFVYQNKVKLIWASKYINTCVGYLESNFLASYTLQQDNPLAKKLIEFALKTLEYLNKYDEEGRSPVLSYSFHVEMFYDSTTTSITLCEAACRTGGAGVSDVMRYLYNVDLNKACVQSQCDDFPNSEGIPHNDFSSQKRAEGSEECAGWLLMYPKVGVVKSVANCDSFVHVYSQSNSSRREFSHMAHCTDCLSQLIITGKNEEDVIKNIQDTARFFSENTVYN